MRQAYRMIGVIVLIMAVIAGCAAPAAPTPTTKPAAAPTAAPAAAAPTTAPAAAPTAAPAKPTAAPAAATAAPTAGTYKVGAVLAITGAAASLGVPERDTLVMLADEVNSKGGIKGNKVEMIIYDNKGDETEAVKAAKRLIDEDKVVAIIGPTRSGDSLALLDTMNKAAIPNVSVAAAIQIVEPVQKWVFKTPQSDRLAISQIVAYLKSKNITKVALVHETVAFGVGGKDEAEKQLPAAGMTIVSKESYGDKDPDMTAQLTKVKGTDAQAIIAWGTSQSSAAVAKGAKQLGITIPVIHSHGIANQTFIDLAGTAANGTIFPAGKLLVRDTLPDSDPQKPVLQAYAKAYKDRFNKEADTFGGHAWDAAKLIFAALEKVGPDPAKIRDEIENTKNFVGISGVFNFSPTDHNGLSANAFAMVEIKDGKWTALK